MNKRKMRMLGMVLAGVLALVPFLHGCAADDGAAGGNDGQPATEQQQQQQNTGSQSDTVYYGQVVAVNGDEITVVLGDLEDAEDDNGFKRFVAQENEITFNKGDVAIVNEAGDVVDAPTLAAEEYVVMSGSGKDSDFRPTKLEMLGATENGINPAVAEQGLNN